MITPVSRQSLHYPPQYKQGAVENGADNHLPDLGAAVGGISSTKEDGIPLRTVLDSNFDIIRVKNTLEYNEPLPEGGRSTRNAAPDPAKTW